MKGYWTVWGIPANVTRLAKNAEGIGRVGAGFRGGVGYEPPHSEGPGLKMYVLHVYALSREPNITQADSEVNREVLLAAIQGSVLAKADLSVTYERGSDREKVAAKQSQPTVEVAGGGQRKPWIQMHGAELDEDKDGAITLTEMQADMERGVAKYDTNRDGIITPAEIEVAGDSREGAAFAGLLYRHAIDLDSDNDSRLTPVELGAAVQYLFSSADRDLDGKISSREAANATNAPLPIPDGRK